MDLTSPWLAAALAVFVWWFATGVILCIVRNADRRGPDAHLMSVILSVPVLFAGVAGFLHTLHDAAPVSIYASFLSALAIWGWIELAFLSGVITGPSPLPRPATSTGWERFLRAWGTVAYHEILLAVTLVLMVGLAREAANPFGLWTFAVLFFARISAKLNLFFGVPKVNVDFLPRPLAHLKSHFRITRISPMFPVSVTALTFAAACWIERLIAAPDAGAVVGFTLLSALTALALLEHWFMVLPIPDERLWRWMMPAPKQNDTTISEDPHGL